MQRAARFADQVEASERQRYDHHLRELLEDRGDRALFRAVWRHQDDSATGGSAGLFFGVCVVAADQVVRMDLFATEAEARAALG